MSTCLGLQLVAQLVQLVDVGSDEGHAVLLLRWSRREVGYPPWGSRRVRKGKRPVGAYDDRDDGSTRPRHDLREEANDLLGADRRAAPDAARVAGGRQRAADHPGARARGASRACRSTSRRTRRRAGSPRCSPAPARARRSCCAATWTPCRMHEDTGLDFASNVDGAMHACGHDTHTAMLVGAARAAGRPPRRARRAGAVHVPAGRGGPPRRPVHARRGPARRPAAGRRDAVAGHRRPSPSTSRRRCRRAG